ncbi:unnamed protein product [Paramecium sonneborni]|uniref:Uncharacterized protein n=1 Tax=Paramecium sonneborni TaxID=65129 RepID=A0A8S1R4B3_9CILI|nr:unnamed protein product [Paramecium sonneborni]
MRHQRIESLGPLEDVRKKHTKSEVVLSSMFKLPKVQVPQSSKNALSVNPNWSHLNYQNDKSKTNNTYLEIQEILLQQVSLSYPNVLNQVKKFIQQSQMGITLTELTKNSQLIESSINLFTQSIQIILQIIKEKEPKKIELNPPIETEIQRKFSLALMKESNNKIDRETQIVNNELKIINHKLQNELNQLATKLRNLEISMDVELLKEKIKELTEELKQRTLELKIEIQNRDQQLIKHLQKIAQLKSIIQQHDEKIEELQTYINTNQERFTQMETTFMSVYNERYYWKDVSKMLEEDLLSQQMRYQKFLAEEAKSKKKLQLLQRELDQIKIEKSKRVEIPEFNKEAEENLQKLLYLFTKEKFHMVQMKAFIQDKMSKLNEQEQQQYQFMKNLKLDHIYMDRLNKYTYPRQSFLVFYESQIKLIESEYKNINRHKISLNYFAIIRAILDAKFNEFQYLENLQVASKFADFVFSWISTFSLDKYTKQIIQVNQDQLDNIRLDFLMDTLNPKLGQIHEVITFNQFLFEQSSLDEVYYYLHCRYMLFKGQVKNLSRSNFETIMYIKIEQAEQLIQEIMHKYPAEQIIYTKNMIKEMVVTKQKIKLVDSHYVLRILLELYRQERQTRLAVLKEMFHSCLSLQSFGKYGVNYRNFRKIFQFNFPTSSEVEICSLFREAHMCGDGIVTAESFFTAATEQNFFIKQLQLQYLMHPPQVEFYKLSYCEFNLPYLDFYNHYNQIPKKLIQNVCLSMGLEYVNAELNKYYQIIDALFAHPYNIYSLIQMITKLISIFNKVQMLKNLQKAQEEWTSMELEAIRQLVNQIPGVFGLILDLDGEERLNIIQKNQKIRALQLVGKRKALKFYSFISAMLNAKVKHEKQPDASPKRGMRKSGKF